MRNRLSRTRPPAPETLCTILCTITPSLFSHIRQHVGIFISYIHQEISLYPPLDRQSTPHPPYSTCCTHGSLPPSLLPRANKQRALFPVGALPFLEKHILSRGEKDLVVAFCHFLLKRGNVHFKILIRWPASGVH